MASTVHSEVSISRARRRSTRACSSLVLLLCAASACGAKTVLRSGLSEREANQLLVALDRAAIAADKRSESGPQAGYCVDVARRDGARALRVLDALRLPPEHQPGFDALYGAPGLLATPAEERARWSAAMGGELARSLERMPGVLEARVHLTPGEAQLALDATPPPLRAAVLLQRRGDRPPIDESLVRNLLTGALRNLPADQVTIVQVAIEPEPLPARRWTRVGPFTAERSSATPLRAVLATALALDLALALALVALLRARRRGTSA